MDRSRFVSAVALVLAAATAASAQNAIGDGRRLDRNLLRGSGRVNPSGRDLAAEVRFRNAIVTGNAPGGLSFRGNAGYRAPGEFMGQLGSNSQFAFRRDSVYSGLAGLGIRGTDALQYQFALTVGNTPPQGLMGTGSISRSGGDLVTRPGATATSPRADTPVSSIPAGQPGADTRGTDMWVLRSPAAFVSTRSLQPAVLAVVPGAQPGQEMLIAASSLRGLTSGPLPKQPPVEPPPGSARRMELGAGGLVTGAGEQEPGTPEDPSRRTGYQDLMDRMAARGASLPARTPPSGAEPQTEPEWRRRLNELKKQLEQLNRPGADRPVQPGTRPEPPDPGTVELLRDPGGRITRLAPSGFDAYAVHMQRGQQQLREGQFFAAEERFTAALGARPDDAMAAIGRVHAQLGASLYGSAAANLRALLVSHPELAGTRYGAELFPDAATSARIIGRLSDMVSSGAGSGPETGLLLAYVGYQTGDSRAVERGLASLQEAPGAPAVPAQLKELGRVLRGVWTGAEPEK